MSACDAASQELSLRERLFLATLGEGLAAAARRAGLTLLECQTGLGSTPWPPAGGGA